MIDIDEIVYYLDHYPQSFASQLSNNRAVMLALVNNRAWVRHREGKDVSPLFFASPTLQDDDDLVLAAINKNATALYYASLRLRNNKQLVNTAVSQHSMALQAASATLQDDEEIVENAIVKLGPGNTIFKDMNAFYYASARLQQNREFVKKLVIQAPWLLATISPTLRDDDEIVEIAIKRGVSRAYASERLQNDKKIIMIEIGLEPLRIHYVPPALKEDPDLWELAINQQANVFLLAPVSIRDNKKIVSTTVGQDGLLLTVASARLQDDLEIVLLAVKQNWLALSYASPRLKNNPLVVATAVKQNPQALGLASQALQINYGAWAVDGVLQTSFQQAFGRDPNYNHTIDCTFPVVLSQEVNSYLSRKKAAKCVEVNHAAQNNANETLDKQALIAYSLFSPPIILNEAVAPSSTSMFSLSS